VITGGIVKATPLLASPPIVTTTFPVVAPLGTPTVMFVALQFVGVAVVPLKVTVLLPCVAPKFVPVIVTDVPTGPNVTDRLVMLGGTVTVKLEPLLASPPTVTTTFPVAAPLGTAAVMLVALQFVGVAVVPLKVTVLLPCVAPKFVPVIVTDVPTGPDVTDRLVMLGGTVTVNATPVLARPPTVTTTFPVVAPLGSATVILFALQFVGVAVVPLKATVLLPCVVPKFVPVIVTDVPMGPDVGEMPVMLGGTVTVNATPLLASPPTVTTTFPVAAPLGTATVMLVALQFVGVAVVPLKVTVLLPCVGPKFVPVIVTDVPTGPDVTDRLVMLGGTVTVKATPVLARPPTVTTTFPVVAPLGTATVMLVALQFVGVAVVPLKVTVLLPCVAPKFVPVIVTDVPTGPDVTDRLVMLGCTVTVKLEPLLACPPTVTTTFPVVAPLGTPTVMLVALQFVGVAVVALKVTVLLPCVAPKFVPVIVTEVPTGPDVTDRLVMLGGTVTVKATPLLASPPTVTTTSPVVAPLGTAAVMLVGLQFAGVAVVPLKVTVLLPCVFPKFVPVIVTDVPTGPDVTDRLVMLGGTVTRKATPLLTSPPTATTTFPVVAPLGTASVMLVALQFVGVAVVPLKVTVLLPCVGPKFVPAIVTDVPTGPDVTDRLVMLGDVTVKLEPLLASPPTVTTTLPVAAPLGTATVMLVALQFVGVADVPLKVTVLLPCVAPKFVPVIVTDVPTGPDVTDRLVMLGGTVTVKLGPLLACPPTVTTTFPVVAPLGTAAVMLVALQFMGVAAVPLRVTVLLPCVAPKFVPVIVTTVPTGPEVGDRPVTAGPHVPALTLLTLLEAMSNAER
jgi:hypothetical protein